MNNAKRFVKTTAIYFFGDVLTKIITFFMLPMYTSKIAADAMGYYDLASNYLGVIVPLVCMEVWSGVLRFSFDYLQKEDKYKVFANGSTLFAASAVLYTAGYLVIGSLFQIQYGLLIFLCGLTQMLQLLYTSFARSLAMNLTFMVSGVLGSFANITTNIIMIGFLGFGIESMFIGLIISYLLQAVIMECKVKFLRHFRLRDLDFALLKNMARFCAPLCVNTIAFWLLSSYNRVAISGSMGLEATGIFGVAARFTSVIILFVSVFNRSWQELSYSMSGDASRDKLYTTATNLYIKFLGFGIILLQPATKIIFPFLIDPAYGEALGILPMYYLATMMTSLSGFLGYIFDSEKKTHISFISMVVSGLLNVAVIHLLLPHLGLHAATIALFIGFFSNVVLRIVMLRKSVHIKIHVNSFYALAILVLFVISAVIFYTLSTLWNAVWLVVMASAALFAFKQQIRQGIAFVKTNLLKKSKE